MILRLVAAISLAIGIAALSAYFQWVGEAPWSTGAERHLRQVKERTTSPARYEPFTFADFVALPHGRPLDEVAAIEGRAVSLEAYMYLATVSSDGDYHVSLADSAWTTWPGDGRTITAEITPQFLRGSANWSLEPLSARLKPLSWYGPWPGGPSKVRISGWLLYDYQYDEPFLKRKAGLLPNSPISRRLTGWEIHPVTRIEVWDDSLAAYVEYPR